jgi:hypothetical protein
VGWGEGGGGGGGGDLHKIAFVILLTGTCLFEKKIPIILQLIFCRILSHGAFLVHLGCMPITYRGF